jgi:ribosome biogenesis protein BRX1
VEQQATNAKEARLELKLHGQDASTSLVEIGPRFVLNPIRIFRGSFGGQTLYQNKDFVSPNTIRSMAMKKKGHAYEARKDSQKKRKTYQESIIVPENPLESVFK